MATSTARELHYDIEDICERHATRAAEEIADLIKAPQEDSEEIAKLRRDLESANDCILRQQREINRLKGCSVSGKVA